MNYLHLGGNTVVRTRDVLGVFDLDNTSTSPRTREFLTAAERRGQVTGVGDDLPKSFVLCCEGEKTTVYLSQLSASTLQRRAMSRQNEFGPGAAGPVFSPQE